MKGLQGVIMPVRFHDRPNEIIVCAPREWSAEDVVRVACEQHDQHESGWSVKAGEPVTPCEMRSGCAHTVLVHDEKPV